MSVTFQTQAELITSAKWSGVGLSSTLLTNIPLWCRSQIGRRIEDIQAIIPLHEAHSGFFIPPSERKACNLDEFLIRELVLRIKGEFELPYKHEELCHCRKVPTATVLNSIYLGAKEVSEISRLTSAGTGCGTCRPHIQTLIDHSLL